MRKAKLVSVFAVALLLVFAGGLLPALDVGDTPVTLMGGGVRVALADSSVGEVTGDDIKAVIDVIKRLLRMSNEDISWAISIAKKYSLDEFIPRDQLNRLESNGLNQDRVDAVLGVLKGAGWSTIREDVEENDFSTLISLANQIIGELDPFLDRLAQCGVTRTDLFNYAHGVMDIISKAGASPSSNELISSDVKKQIEDKFFELGLYTKISKESLAANGVNWANFDKLVGLLTDDELAFARRCLDLMKEKPAPEPGPGPAPAPPAVPPGVIPPSELNITVTDGRTNVQVPDRAINNLLDRGIVDAVVQMPEAKDVVVSLSSGAVSRLAEKGGTLTVSAAVGQVTLPAAALPELPAGAALSVGMRELSAEEAAPVVSQLPPELKAVSGVVDVSVRADGQEVACPARLVVTCPVTAGIDPKKCFIYRVKPDGTFECVGGDVVTDEAGNVVGFGVDLSRLSKYVVMEYTRTFGDTVGHWAERDILFMAARGVAKGVAPGKFEPNRPVTRAEFAALLVRALGIKPDPGRELRFADVDRSKWYYGEVAAAFGAGIVKGVSADRFAPEASVTREQVAAMVARALKFAGKEIALSPGETEARIGAYSDGSRVSAWAREEMARALKCGIVTGRTETTLVPQGDSTRAEAAAMLRRMLKQIL